MNDIMEMLTKKGLINQLSDVDDNTLICIRCKTPSGDAAYYDLDLEVLDQGIVLHSEGLDLTIEADIEMIKEEEGLI